MKPDFTDMCPEQSNNKRDGRVMNTTIIITLKFADKYHSLAWTVIFQNVVYTFRELVTFMFGIALQ